MMKHVLERKIFLVKAPPVKANTGSLTSTQVLPQGVDPDQL